MSIDMAIPSEEFSELVRRSVRKGASADEQEFLQENLELWRNELLKLKRDVEIQFTNKKSRSLQIRQGLSDEHGEGSEEFTKAFNDHLSEVGEWKVRTNRFLSSIEETLQDVKLLRVQEYYNAEEDFYNEGPSSAV